MTQASLAQIAKQERNRREILLRSDLIPPLPDLVARVLGMLDRPDTESADLARELQNDQVLVARMLAMVNSALYGLSQPVRTIREGVVVLGFRGLRSLVLATGAARLLQHDFRWYGHHPRGLWQHAVCVAAGSRQLARCCGMDGDEGEQLFVGGLLHDIGKLLLLPYLQGLDSPEDVSVLCQFERRHVGMDHAEAGALVSARWNLPDEIQQVVRGSHLGADEGGDEAHALPCAVVRIADGVAHELGIGFLPDRNGGRVVDPVDVERLGLQQDFAAVHEQLVAHMQEAVASLQELGE